MSQPFDTDDLLQCVATLRSGGVVLYPTDTIWGLGCDASNPEAIDRIYSIKHRPERKPMSVLVDSKQRLKDCVEAFDTLRIPDAILEANPGITVIYPKARRVAREITADDGSLGIRITREAFSQALCREFGGPIVSTSANLSGEPSPSYFHEIDPEVVAQADYVTRYRRDDTTPHAPSGIVKITPYGTMTILRPSAETDKTTLQTTA